MRSHRCQPLAAPEPVRVSVGLLGGAAGSTLTQWDRVLKHTCTEAHYPSGNLLCVEINKVTSLQQVEIAQKSFVNINTANMPTHEIQF